ncbi:hypothetical protein KAU15_06120 [candidate division WOR-3 bacterium]|nr:hypothetical protein [candidate division WOR-3 bacterium]
MKIILKIFNRTEIWLLISILICSFSFKSDSGYSGMLISDNTGRIIILSGSELRSVNNNKIIWTKQLNYIPGDISVFAYDIYLLAENRIYIITTDGREKGHLEISDNYLKFVRISNGFYLYNDKTKSIDFFFRNDPKSIETSMISIQIGLMRRMMNDDVLLLSDNTIMQVNEEKREILIRENHIIDYMDVIGERIYYTSNDSLYYYENGEKALIMAFSIKTPFTIKNNKIYFSQNNNIKSIEIK